MKSRAWNPLFLPHSWLPLRSLQEERPREVEVVQSPPPFSEAMVPLDKEEECQASVP